MSYETGVLLGRGGMGEVYKAYDPRLKRHVALKVLRVYSAEAALRLLREARAQAKLDNPHICKVYEVGEDPRHPRIVMQLIDGRPLDQVAPEMTLEQRIRALAQVAEAVHAAHRTGMIHRDLKPANILVERTGEAEGFHPYVVDFGLVYQQDATSLTVEGAVLGTPPYTAPEQAEGWSGAADRRSDVYSLGATLYEVLTGRPVFSGSPTELLLKTLGEEPKAPRKVLPQLPQELETVVLKCLEKEPRRRYGSARALAEDLRRFLDGEPIQAVPASLRTRIAKKVNKHRALTAVAVAAVVAVATFAALALEARWQAARRAEAAQRFTAEVKDLEWLLRAARMSPLHDIRPQENRVRERLGVLKRQIPASDAALLGPTHFALGRGFLSLGDLREARLHLEQAWEAAFRPPEVANALGLVYGRLFEAELDGARGIADPLARAAAEDRARREYRDPALEMLAASRGAAIVVPAYLEGLIAFYEGDAEAALKASARALEEAPWLYEAELLAGDVLVTRGNGHRAAGEHEGALRAYTGAEGAYRRAVRMAESATSVYSSLCRLMAQRMELELYGPGGDLVGLLEAGLGDCRRGLEANPDDPRLHLEIAALWRVRSTQLSDRGGDPSDAWERVFHHARRAVELEPREAQGWQQISATHSDRAHRTAEDGGDPTADFDAAIEAGRRGAALARNPVIYLNTLGTAYNRLAEYRMGSGEDPTEAFQRAIEVFEQSTELDPSYGYAFNNLSRSHTFLARFHRSRGRDPRPELERAAEACERAVALNEENAYAWNNLGVAQMDLGRVTFERGQEPVVQLRKAVDSFLRSQSINPTYAAAYNNLGMSHLLLARHQVSRGLDPGPALAAAEESLLETVRLNSRAFQPHVNLGRVELLRARYELATGQPPGAALERSRGHYRAALDRNRRYAAGMSELAETWLLEARWQSALRPSARDATGGRSAAGSGTLERATELFEEALAIDSDSAGTLRGLAEVALREAQRSGLESASVPGRLQQARGHLERALELQPGDPESSALAALLARRTAQAERSRGGEPAADLEWGLARAEEGLRLNPNHAELRGARGSLHLERAQAGGSSEAARRALEDLEAALALNPLLASSLAGDLEAARALAEP